MNGLPEGAISCLPADLRLNIEVDLAELKLGDTVHLSSLVLPKGVEIPQLKLGPDHDVAIVVARQGRVEAEETPAEGEAAAAEAPKAASEGEAKDDADGAEKSAPPPPPPAAAQRAAAIAREGLRLTGQ